MLDTTTALPGDPVDEEVASAGTTHVEALKASSIIGGSSLIVMLIRMVRTKVVALMLGPAGVGLEAVFDSIMTVAKTLFDGGLGTSGVREIAASQGTGGEPAVARTAHVLRRASLAFGILGTVLVFAAAGPISRFAFGDSSYQWSVRLLSVTVLLASLGAAWGALLTGLRRIGDLARMNVWGTLLGAAVSIPIIYLLGTNGIAVYMVVAAAAALGVAWVYARRVHLPPVSMTGREVVAEARGMVRLGMAFVATALLSTGAVLVLRVMVTRTEGVDAAGIFQAASALSMVYLGFILQAMGTDYFPRLTGAGSDGARTRQIVNDQAEVSLLLALPGILGTLALAPLLIRVFYSGQFDVAADLLAWQMAGMFLRIVSWPVGFVLPAKGRGGAFVATDIAAWTTYIALSWFGLQTFGLVGVGMAFLGMYLFYSILIYAVVRSVSGFRWSPANLRLIVLGSVTIAGVLWARLTLSLSWGTAVGVIVAAAVGVYCLVALVRLVGMDRVRAVVRRIVPSRERGGR